MSLPVGQMSCKTMDFWTLWFFKSKALRSVKTTGPLTHPIPLHPRRLKFSNAPLWQLQTPHDSICSHHGLSSYTVTRIIYSDVFLTLIRGLTARMLRLAHNCVSRALVTCHRSYVFCFCSLVMRKVSRLHWSEDGGVWECSAC